jgi:two-component system LytT family response regulator/two-component system response regulator LytT
MRERATATLSTIVVDDEQLARDELAYLLKDFPEIEVIATASNGVEAVDGEGWQRA